MENHILENKTKTPVRRGGIKDGLWRQNVVLMSGLLAGPVIAGATNLENAVAISIAFTLITYITVSLCRVISRKIVYALRIILYAVVAAVVYIPVAYMLELLMGPTAINGVGIYLPVLVTNPVILAKSETRFYLMPLKNMFIELIGYILGFDIVCIVIGAMRDILVNGRLGWLNVEIGFAIPALETTFGGMIIVGVLAGLTRAVYNRHRNKGGAAKI